MAMTQFARPKGQFGIPENIAAPSPFVGTDEPFVWGQGGSKLTPEQIAAQQAIAQQMMQSDYSPVGSVWEGLGRVADNVTGAIKGRKLEKDATSANEARTAQIAALLGGSNADLAPAIGGGDSVVSALAGDLLKARTPKVQAPTDFQQMLMAGGVQPGTPEYAAQNLARAQSLSDPLVTVSLPDGGIFNGPASQLAAVLRGGGQASGVTPGNTPSPVSLPTAPVGKLTPIGGQTPRASGGFP